jgi:hypothetical protein
MDFEEMKKRLRDQILNGNPKPVLVPVPKTEETLVTTPAKTEETPVTTDTTREAWLDQAWAVLTKHFSETTSWPINLPEVRLSVGFARGKRPGKKLTAQTIFETEDKKPQVFVTPVATSATAVLTLLVEQIAIIRAKRYNESLALSQARCGLITASPACPTTTLAGGNLEKALASIVAKIGTYPHAAVTSSYTPRDSGGVKVQCSESGYKLRISEKWLAKYGAPICPHCSQRMTVGE